MESEMHQPSESCKTFHRDIFFLLFLKFFNFINYLRSHSSHLTANELTGTIPADFFNLADTLERLYSE
jgi:hypothetical protein